MCCVVCVSVFAHGCMRVAAVVAAAKTFGSYVFLSSCTATEGGASDDCARNIFLPVSTCILVVEPFFSKHISTFSIRSGSNCFH